MSYLFVSIFNHFNSIIGAILLSMILGCSRQTNSNINISPQNFKVQVPFMLDHGIIINTYWGSEKGIYVLCLDNYSRMDKEFSN
jgi:hypothetical protein